jgi:hypothetical protein
MKNSESEKKARYQLEIEKLKIDGTNYIDTVAQPDNTIGTYTVSESENDSNEAEG